MKWYVELFFIFLISFGVMAQSNLVLADTTNSSQTTTLKDGNAIQVLESFDKQKEDKEKQDQDQISQHKKQVIMFALGVPLLILLLSTGAVGIAVGLYDKPWFVAHMVLAGLTISLAIVHLIVGLVWFYPF